MDENGVRTQRSERIKEMKSLLGLSNSEKAYTVVHYFLTNKEKEKNPLSVLTIRDATSSQLFLAS